MVSKPKSSIPVEYRYTKDHYLNYSILQLQHNREKAVKAYLEMRDRLIDIEQAIALKACPFYVGQIVSYNLFNGTQPTHVIVVGVAYKFCEPFYVLRVKNYLPKTKQIRGGVKIINNIANIIGAVSVKTSGDDNMVDYENRLRELYEQGHLSVPKKISIESYIPQVVHSRERGRGIAHLSPLVESWLKIQNT